MTTPFDMSRTVRHPDVVCDRIAGVLDQIAALRLTLAAKEDELRQLLEITREMLARQARQEQP